MVDKFKYITVYGMLILIISVYEHTSIYSYSLICVQPTAARPFQRVKVEEVSILVDNNFLSCPYPF